eukprot:TRINITY_DN997_c0_g2_i1.p1 TRINITY_DN997_c0_g2~~TRINITY_DN997_c0_g2_i1.p1  ORF type:complete len:114 (-),score=28.76 TRINITY_DN997_c0_g2_i1:448-789(-)
MSSGSFEKVRGGKLLFKGGIAPSRSVSKKGKRKKNQGKDSTADVSEGADVVLDAGETLDVGTGHAPDGKKSKKYEELFPVETRKFGYVVPEVASSREVALDERVKKKADRYCK